MSDKPAIEVAVIFRSKGESIQIGDNIKITVLEGKRGQTRLRIEGPKGIKISRNDND